LAATTGIGNIYKHCGIHLQLKSVLANNDLKKPFILAYSKNKCDEERKYTEEFKRWRNTAMELFA
jgi:hypothetical protein